MIFRARLPLILASSSPRRREFFAALGLAVRILSPPEAAEPSPDPGEEPVAFSVRAATAKAAAVRDAQEFAPSPFESNYSSPAPYLIIAADTIVVCNSAILDKPQDADDALVMLKNLRGRTHTVITGCALLSPFTGLSTFFVKSSVTFWNCPDPALAAYARSSEPLDKAGAYAAQGVGAFLVERIHGSWSNVVGLPLAEITQRLLALNAIEIIE